MAADYRDPTPLWFGSAGDAYREGWDRVFAKRPEEPLTARDFNAQYEQYDDPYDLYRKYGGRVVCSCTCDACRSCQGSQR